MPRTVPARYLVLQTAKGQIYLDPGEIAYVETEGIEEKVKRRQPRLLLTVGETDKAENKVAISYLTRGLSWAPSYRIDITDPKTLVLEQQAVIKNELTDLDGAEIKLISGFPSVQFAHVTSPLSTRTTWAAFFQELGQQGWRETDLTSNPVMTRNSRWAIAPHPMPSACPQYRPVRAWTCTTSRSASALWRRGIRWRWTWRSGKASYERIVEWLVPDTRDEFGRNVGGRGYHRTHPSGVRMTTMLPGTH